MIDSAEVNSLHGDVERKTYIPFMREVAEYAGREDLTVAPEVARGLGWSVTDVETGDTFDFLAGNVRAEVSALTKRRIIGAISSSEEPSAIKAMQQLKQFSNTGDNYQFSSALDKAEGQLQSELLAILVEHSIMSGFVNGATGWIERVGGEQAGTQKLGYDLGFFEKLWEFSLHSDIGPYDRSHLAEKMITDSRGTTPFNKTQILSTETWKSPEGVEALATWKLRYEAAQEEVLAVLVAQSDAFCADPIAPENLHKLGNDIEQWMVSQWQWYAKQYDQDEATRCVMPLIEANLRVAFTLAETELRMAESELDTPVAIPGNSMRNRVWGSVHHASELVIKPEDSKDLGQLNLVAVLTQESVAQGTMEKYRNAVLGLQERLRRVDPRMNRVSAPAENAKTLGAETVSTGGLSRFFKRHRN